MPADEPVFLASNRGYRYGDGLFETIKVKQGKILLADHHFDRLFSGLALLKFEISRLFLRQRTEEEILSLCKKNNCGTLARIRLSVFKGNGGLYDEDKALQYLIECWPLNDSVNTLNENGLVIDIYPDARKSCDRFSNLKSANFLPYSMAALFVKENKLNDALVLNSFERIADSTIANLFIIKGEVISTPSLQEGGVNGVMRRHLIEKALETGYVIQEDEVAVADIEDADELFLTNAINGIRWVRQFRDKTYINKKTVEIYDRLVKTIQG